MIVKKVVEHPMGVLMLYTVLLVFGAYTLRGLKLELTPDFTMPFVSVSTIYEQEGSEEIESSITIPLENVLSSLSGVKKITSKTTEGLSQVNLEFNWGVNIDEKVNEIRDKLETVKDFLPKDAKTPSIGKFDPSIIPFMQLYLSGNSSINELRKIAKDTIAPMLEQADGVASVSIQGGSDRIIKVDISQNRLEAYNLTMVQVASMLRGQNIDIGGGTIKENQKDFAFKAKGKFSSLEEIENAVVSYKPQMTNTGQKLLPIKLKDIAEISDTHKEIKGKAFLLKKDSLVLAIQRQSGKNIVKTSKIVRTLIDKLNKETLKGENEIGVLSDTSTDVTLSITNITNSAITGALYAMLIIFLFLRNLKSSLIIGTSIPMSIVITLIFMQFLGMTLNVMSLAGLALGVGMVVDSSVVILENIFQFRERGARLKISTVLGASEMMRSIIASTLTTVSVFIPLIIFKDRIEIIGILFNDLSLTVIISLLSSLLIAITLIPILSSKFFKVYTRSQKPIQNKFMRILDEFFESIFLKLEKFYGKAIKLVLKNRLITIIGMFVILILSFGVIPIVGFIFMPQSEGAIIAVKAELPKGSQLEETEKVMLAVSQDISDTLGDNKDIVFSFTETLYRANIYVRLKKVSERNISIAEAKELIRGIFIKYPIANLDFGKAPGPPTAGGGKEIQIKLKSKNNKKLADMALKIKDYINYEMKELDNATLDKESNKEEYVLRMNRERMYILGLSAASVTQEIRANVVGITATKFSDNGEDIDIILYVDSAKKNSVLNLDRVGILNSSGIRIPISSFAKFTQELAPSSINREARTRTLTVEANLATLKDADGKLKKTKLVDGNNALKKAIAERFSYDSSVMISLSGDLNDLIKYGKETVFLFGLAVLLVYSLLVLQFESLLDPFIIFLSIPLMFIGINLFYLITGVQYSMFALVGALILAGVVVNNSIVLIDYIKLLMARGAKLKDACITAGERRLRPILITSLTTILGMLPLALNKAEGSQLIRPIAQAFSGGMISSTLTTLLFVPALYSLVHSAKGKMAKRKETKIASRAKKIKKLLEEQEKDLKDNED